MTIVTFFGPFHVSRFWQNNILSRSNKIFRFLRICRREPLFFVFVFVHFFVLFSLASRRFLFLFYFLLFFSCFVTFSILEVEGAGGGENESKDAQKRYIRNTWSHWAGALKSQQKKLGRWKEKTTLLRSLSCLISCRLVIKITWRLTSWLKVSIIDLESKLWNTTFCLWAPGRSIVKFPKQTKFNTESLRLSQWVYGTYQRPSRGSNPGRYAGIAFVRLLSAWSGGGLDCFCTFVAGSPGEDPRDL